MKIFVVTKLENISSMTRSLSSQCSGDFGEKSALKTVKYEKKSKKSLKIFGEKKKVRIFAVRLRNNGSSLKILKD